MHIDDEVTARTAKASVAFGRLRTNVWERNGIRLDTKLKVDKAVVLPTLVYACETWTVYQRHAKKLNRFHLSCLRKLLKIRLQDKIPDTEVLKKANMQSVHTLLKLAQLKLCTHDQDLRTRKFCIYANFAYVSKSIFYFALTWLLRINRICRKLKFYSIKIIVISLNSGHALIF